MRQLLTVANGLSFLRVLLAPLFLYFFFGEDWVQKGISLVIFIVAALTDLYDGRLARKFRTVSRFGRFLDPLADKILVGVVLFSFVLRGLVNIWIVSIIMFREVVVTFLRLYALSVGRQVVTARLAKLKTTIQMVGMITILLMVTLQAAFIRYNMRFWLLEHSRVVTLSNFLMFVIMVFAMVSGWRYFFTSGKIR